MARSTSNGDCFVRGIVHDHQALGCPGFGCAVEHEVHRPYLVDLHWPQKRLTLTDRHFSAPAAPHLQVLLAYNLSTRLEFTIQPTCLNLR